MISIASGRPFAGALLAACTILLAGVPLRPAVAQAPATGQPSDPVKDAFDALSEAERRAVQDALVWTGDYKGTIDGILGRGGMAALAAYAKKARVTPDAVLEDAKRKQLIAQGQRLRAAARFSSVQEVRSGATIALPAAVFTRRANTPSGARWTNAAGSARLETFRDANGDLATLYEGLRAPAPGRRVTYSVLRQDFLVVAGEDGRGIFYIRAAQGDVDGKPLMRGYELSYARALQPSLGTYAIAIANGFQPFPAPGASVAATGGSGAAAPSGPRRVVEASAIALAPNRAVTALSRDCPDMRIAERPARILRSDKATGLALVETQGLRAALTNPAPRAPDEADVFVLFAAQGAGQGASVSLASGQMLKPAASSAPWRVSAAVQDGIGGAAIFDRSGSWMGVLAQPPQEPRRIAGIIPEAAWRTIPSESVLSFLAASGVKLEAGMITTVIKSAGEIARANASAIVAVSCQR